MRARELAWTARHLLHRARCRTLSPEVLNWRAWKRFWTTFRDYGTAASNGQRPEWSNLYPCLGDDTEETEIEPTYFYQDAWAFERIVNSRPAWHVDVGSDHKYVALLSRVVRVTMVDIRPLSLPLDSLQFRKGSVLDLPFEDASVPSLSSLCVLEHIGLGRYGDPLDPLGTEKAMAELKRVLSSDGELYVSLPLDDENRTYFNAHRAFREGELVELFRPLKIVDRRYIYGTEFLESPRSGFGVGCYHLRASDNAVQRTCRGVAHSGDCPTGPVPVERRSGN